MSLPSSILRRTDLLLPYDSLALALNHAAEEANFPLFGLELSTFQGLHIFGPLGILASQAKTIANSLEILQKFFNFHASGVNIRLISEGETACLRLDIATNPAINQAQLMEMSMGLAQKVLCELSPSFINETVIHLKHCALDTSERYRAVINAELAFSETHNQLTFPKQLLSNAPSSTLEDVKTYLEDFLTQQSDGRKQPLLQNVSRLIYELLPTGEATLTTIAPMLGMKVRPLQRKLRQQGTEFRTLLEEARFEIACEALINEQPITDIALNLGYSDLSAFSRAFKRWSGVSPQSWRDKAHGTARP